jgi:hypothetical protein
MLLQTQQYEILELTWIEPIWMELNNILRRQLIPWQPVTSFRSISTDGKKNIKGWARGECKKTKYTRIVRTDPPLWLDLNVEVRKGTEESSMQPFSVVIVYNIIFTRDIRTHKTMLEPTVTMYGCQTWSVTDRITVSKFLEEEHFEEGVWASNWVRFGKWEPTPNWRNYIKPLIWLRILGEHWCDSGM